MEAKEKPPEEVKTPKDPPMIQIPPIPPVGNKKIPARNKTWNGKQSIFKKGIFCLQSVTLILVEYVIKIKFCIILKFSKTKIVFSKVGL